jgi:hypothetical protein
MAYALYQSKLNFLHLRNPDMRKVFAQGIAAFYYQDLAATAVAVHAAVAGNAALAFPGPFTSPATPRAVSVLFAAGWTGGNVTVVGIDQFGRAQTETITASAGATVEGTKIFKTVSSAAHTAAGDANACTLQTGLLIGIPVPLLGAWGIQLIAGVAAQPTAWNATVHAFQSASAPDGSKDYTIIVPVDWDAYFKMVVSEQPNI